MIYSQSLAWGRGIEMMVQGCRQYRMLDPVIEEDQGGIRITFLKDIYTEEFLKKQNLPVRQIDALLFLKENGSITNAKYQELFDISKRTATNDLQLLIEKGLISKIGTTGKGTFYILQRGNKGAKWPVKGQ